MTNARYAAEMRPCILELDVAGVRRLGCELAPEMHQPVDDDEALQTLHLARTKLASASVELRLYSQAWLDEREKRGLAYAVGISVGASPDRQDVADEGARRDDILGDEFLLERRRSQQRR